MLDRGDAADLMDVVRHELGYSRIGEALPAQGHLPRHLLAPRQHAAARSPTTLAQLFPWCAEWERELTRLFRAYVERKLANQALDYDDLLLYWHAMMEDAALAAEIGAHFDHVLVDEYQDTNVLQAEILLRLRPEARA